MKYKGNEYTSEQIEQHKAWEDTERWREFGDKDHGLGTPETHPSYGVVGLSRVSGNASLFESEVNHMYYISLRIKEAERWQDGTQVRTHAGRQLIEIFLTEAQFAQLMTSPNIGEGVPCTIHYCAADKPEGKPYLHPKWGIRPDPPPPERFEKKFHAETEERAKIISDNLASLESELSAMLSGETKVNKGNLGSLLAKIQSSRQQIESNIPYVLRCVEEQLEKKINAAVIEFEGYMAQSLQARGLSSAQESLPELAIRKSLPKPKEP